MNSPNDHSLLLNPLYEDNHLLILNKPPGLLTQPNNSDRISLEQIAKSWLKKTYNKNGNVFLEAVHRLDAPVSGIVVFGKTSKAVSRLNESIRLKKFKKIYWAWVEGRFDKENQESILEHYLFHDDFQAKVVTSDHPHAKICRLKYKVLQIQSQNSLIEIELETGRYHQIRIQMSTINHPIQGDEKYYGKLNYIPGIIPLHHRKLEFIHPVSKKNLTIEAPLPEGFNRLFDENHKLFCLN